MWLRNKKTGGLFNTDDIKRKEFSTNKFERLRDEDLEREYDDKFNKLSKEEKQAILKYTSELAGEYKNVNEVLNKYGNDFKKIIEWSEIHETDTDYVINGLDSIMKKNTINQNIKAIRMANAEDENFINAKENSIINYNSYMSTTLSNYIAEGYERRLKNNDKTPLYIEIDIPKGTRGFYIGKNTNNVRNESELLLDRGLKYKVKEYNKEKGYIKLKVINGD